MIRFGRALGALSLGVHVLIACATAPVANGRVDENLWLEDIHGPAALDWVRAQNARTRAALEAEPSYPDLLAGARAVLLAKDRVPFASFARGYFRNFWQDETHKRGLWRRATYAEYLKPDPKWEVLIDFDELARRENENWVFKGQQNLTKASSRHLVRLSRGGGDAAVLREFDVDEKRFVTDGFNLPEAKSRTAGLDEDTLLVATDEGPDSLTTSGYPRVVRRWRRGQPFAAAETVFTAERGDMEASPFVIRHGRDTYAFVLRNVTFWEREYHWIRDGRPRLLNLPRTAEMQDVRGGRVYLTLKEPLRTEAGEFPSGALVSLKLDADRPTDVRLIFAPNQRQSITQVNVAQGRVVLSLLEDVRGKVIEIKLDHPAVPRVLDLPKNGVLEYSVADDDDPTDFDQLTYASFLDPYAVYRVRRAGGRERLALLKASPARFRADDAHVTQRFATSRDGTRVPYFIIGPKRLARDGQNPTLMMGYGGFEASMTPEYDGLVGRLWIERGGVYVVANIRGGGEYGPAWHLAALREHRTLAYDDFAAVAEDLIKEKITSPAHLGMTGASNGGLLTGAMLVRRPDLFNAALIRMPLLDMRRYTKLGAGASWIGEYGDPDQPGDWAFLRTYSPYQNVRPNVRYPRAMITTATTDDRVHPGHARKMAARLISLGHPTFFFENTDGGHHGSADLEQSVRVDALEYAYLWGQLKR